MTMEEELLQLRETLDNLPDAFTKVCQENEAIKEQLATAQLRADPKSISRACMASQSVQAKWWNCWQGISFRTTSRQKWNDIDEKLLGLHVNGELL